MSEVLRNAPADVREGAARMQRAKERRGARQMLGSQTVEMQLSADFDEGESDDVFDLDGPIFPQSASNVSDDEPTHDKSGAVQRVDQSMQHRVRDLSRQVRNQSQILELLIEE